MAAIATDANEMLAEMEATVGRLSGFATDVATAAEQVTASSEEVRAASEEVSGSIQEIADGADRQNDALQSIETETNALDDDRGDRRLLERGRRRRGSDRASEPGGTEPPRKRSTPATTSSRNTARSSRSSRISEPKSTGSRH